MQTANRNGLAAMTGNTYCGNLLWQLGLTLFAPQTAAAVLATAQCVKYGLWGMLPCAAMVDVTLYEQGNEINDKLHKCGMKCIFGK